MCNGSSLVVAVLNVHKFILLLGHCLHASPNIEILLYSDSVTGQFPLKWCSAKCLGLIQYL